MSLESLNPLHRRRRQEDADMDITPMIDIVFLLLIFFLVCSAMGKQSIVQLPKAKYGSPISPRTSTVLTVAGMEGESRIYIGEESGEPLPNDPEIQQQKIVQAVEQGVKNGKTDVMIRADRKLFHGEIVRIESIASSVSGVNLYVIIQD